ncbi:undecaprenyldiphospho-muramoylpentapeptide beta-N-acetylglucosaminyltransferase [Formicincola oecophyllae]|uniref:UDP-N-acetylglucosamine--N-acetylmuramyl-(pentapeptide) pyrophosphoryl-undecaprenol N-acetylglucosamine transferase n=1 Tax=Formicincola oecophyllae TaxID=2558361 RepID=A0A4Y6UBG2_9PROT|nr:undecaprenyldiphospho-muramoylpentapeptide beta-N-acetylglucosaminyltransferase [Formicincola oecophyllae]
MHKPVLLAAGGTGGHLFPAEAVADHLQAQGHDTILVTDQRAVVRPNSPFRRPKGGVLVLGSHGVAGKGVLGKVRGVTSLLKATLQARAIVRRLQPICCVGFGGYPSVPPLLSTQLLPPFWRPPVIIHEANAVLGKANRMLARFAQLGATSFPEVAGLPVDAHVVETGMPVRPAIEALLDVPYVAPTPDGPLNLLVWGGSLGAKALTETVPLALAKLPPALRARLRVVQQIAPDAQPKAREVYAKAGIKAELHPFIHDVPGQLRQAHLVVGRAGGSSVAELALAGRPSLMVPLPVAASDEQTANAKAMMAVGAGWMMPQREMTPDHLAKTLEGLLSQPDTLAEAARRAHSFAKPHAARRLADLALAAERS